MNLFQKYGIKEVADVTFYSITKIGDEEFYTPVLFLDTLKISTLDKSSETAKANGGYGNKRLITWNFGKDITLTLEDALFTPASMSMMWGGWLNNKLSKYASAIAKLNIANKYGKLNYSTKAYPSPELTNEEWEIVFEAATTDQTKYSEKGYYYGRGDNRIEYNRKIFKDNYFKRQLHNINEKAAEQYVIDNIIKQLTNLKKFGEVETDYHDIEVIDRTERCTVKDKDGLVISTSQQLENLKKYYMNDKTHSYVIYYDPKTMLPLFRVLDDRIIGLNTEKDLDFDGAADQDKFKLKVGTPYIKWSRTVKFKTGDNDGVLGKTLVIDADTFPDQYKIVGETYIREQKTGKDQRYQFIIHRAAVTTDTNITLEAEGEPTTFSMDINVLAPENDIMIELVQYNVDEDLIHGGTYITAQKSQYTNTMTILDDTIKTSTNIDNEEIY